MEYENGSTTIKYTIEFKKWKKYNRKMIITGLLEI